MNWDVLEQLAWLRRLREQGADEPSSRYLAAEALVQAALLGPSWYVQLAQVEADVATCTFEGGRLVSISSDAWTLSPAHSVESAILRRAVSALATGIVRWQGEIFDDSPFRNESWIDDLLDFSFLPRLETPPQTKRERRFRLLRKAVRDPQLFLSDSRIPLLRWLGKRLWA